MVVVSEQSSVATKKERVVFYVDGDIKDRLGKLAERDNRSLSNWLENLVLHEIKKREKVEQEND